MIALLLAALAWVGLHVGIAGTSARGALVARLGGGGFRVGFSLASFVVIALLVMAWRHAPTAVLWVPPAAVGWALVGLMLPAFILFAGAFTTRNPTSVGQDSHLAAEPRGMLRVTRHPMLWSFALWAAIHMVANGDTASLVFFGAFLATALAGMPSLDAKMAARHPADWAGFAGRTSLLPFGAVASGRNRVAWGEVWVPALVGLVAWAAMLHLHRGLIGVSPLPVG